MSEFIPPQDAIVEEETKQEIDFVPPADAEADETVEVEKKSDPKTQSPATDPKDGESSSEDSLSELSPGNLKNKKKKPNKKIVVQENVEIEPGEYEILENIDVSNVNQVDLEKIFNRDQVDLSNLDRKQKDINEVKGKIIGLKKINLPHRVDIESTVIKRNEGDVKGIKSVADGSYYVPIYENDGTFLSDDFFDLENPGINTVRDNSIIQDTPVYIKDVDFKDFFEEKEKPLTREELEQTKDIGILETFEIKEDSPAIREDYETYQKVIDNLTPEIKSKKEQIESEQDPVVKEQLQEELKELNEDLFQARRNYTKATTNAAKSKEFKLEVEKPKFNSWLRSNNKSQFIRNDNGDIEVDASRRDDISYYFELEPVEVRNKINKNYINHGLGSESDGGTVFVFKNPVFKDGKIDLEATAKANGIEGGVITRGRLIEEGVASELYTGQLSANSNNLESFTNFIEKNTTDYKRSNQVAPGVEADPNINKEKKKILNNLKSNINSSKEVFNETLKNTKKITDSKQNSFDQKQKLANQFIKSQGRINEIEDENKKLKTSIDKGQEEINKKREQVKKAITENPGLKQNLIKEYENWEKKFIKDREKNIDRFNSNIKKQESIAGSYKQIYDSSIESIEATLDETGDLIAQQKTYKQELEALMDENNLLSAYEANYRHLELEGSRRVEKMLKKYEGSGNVVKELYNVAAETFAGTRTGTVAAWQLLARGINEAGLMLGTISKSKYKMYNNTFRSQDKQRAANTRAIADQLMLQGNDEKFSEEFAKSLVGGTAVSFAQMAGATLGAPLTGLAGGYFFKSLSETSETISRMENEFVKRVMKEEGLSEAQAIERFNSTFSPGMQKAYSLAKATSEGVFSLITAKILKGKFNPSSKLIEKATNRALRSLTGNVTARDIQIAVHKTIGDTASKCLTKFGRVTTAGIMELLDETAQTGVSYSLDETFNSMTNNELNFQLPNYTSKNFKNEIEHMMGVSMLSGNAGGVFQSLIKTDKVLTNYERETSFAERLENDKFLEEVANTARDVTSLTAAIEMKQEQIGTEVDGEIYTQEDFNSDKFQMQKKFDLYNKIDSELTGTSQFEIASLLEQKENLEKQKESLAKGTTGRIDKKIEAIDNKIKDISDNPQNEKVKELTQEEQIDFTEKQLRIVKLEKVKNLSKDQDLSKEETEELLNSAKVEVFNDDNVDEIAEKYNLNSEDLLDPEGVYLKDEGIILMSETASKGVLEHEAGHNFLEIALNDPKNKDVVFGLADALRKKMREVDPKAADIIDKQIEKYKKDDRYDSEAVAEEIMTYYIQLKKRGLFKKGTTVGSEVQAGFRRLYQGLGMEIEINENNIMDVLDDYVRNTGRGKLTRAQKKLAQGKVKFDTKLREKSKQVKPKDTTTVIDINKKAKVKTKQAAALPIKVDAKSMSTAFDKNITEDLATNEDFKNSEAAIDAFENIENNSQFNSYINQLINRDTNLQGLDSNIKQEVNRKIKENLQLRALKNFKPVVDGNRRSLFSYLYGKADQRGLGGIAQKALLDVKKDYATRVDSDARSIDKPTSEGQAFDIADTSTDIIEEVDRGVAKQPRSTFRRNIVRGKEKGLTDQEVKSFKEITQPIVDKLPPVDDKKYRTKVDQISGKELKSWVKSNVLKGQDYKTFIKENYNNIRDLDLKYLIELDKGLMKQGKSRMFTKPNRRLTTQEDIRKYRDSGRAFVENEAQGVMLYDILDPGADATVEFYTKQTPQNVSNRKGKLAEAIGKKMFKDVLPETRAKKGDTDQQRATSARKTQTRPDLLFAKKGVNEALESLGLVPLKPRNSKGNVVSQEDIEEFEDFLINTFVKYLPVSLLTKTTLANGGRGKFPSQYFTSEQVDKIVAKARGNQEFDLTKEEREALNSVKTSVSTWWDKFKSTGNSVFKNKKWKETEGQKQKGLEILWKQFEKMYKDDPKNAKYIAAFIETSSANSSHIMRMAGYPIGYEINWKDVLSNRGPEREHVIPANQIGEFLFKVATGRFGNKITIDKVMPFINDNYFQILINKNNDHKLKAAGFQSAMPEGFFESIIEAIDKNDPNIAMKVWARYFNPEVNNQVGPDGQKGFNPNEIILEKGSLADVFGVGSNMLSNKEINNPNVVSIQQNLIYKISTDPNFTIKDAQKELLTYIKKPNNTQSLASEQQQATLETEKEIKGSNVMVASKKIDIDELLSKAALIDESLRLANSLDQPIKKIRVFDFDDTIATSKSIVFYTKVDGTKGQLTAEEFAVKGADLVNEGAVMDFSDFNLVREGKRGPLFNIAKKIKEARGNEDLFILTARAPESQQAIYEFLKAEGLEFKKENIVGLGNSTGEAKANWIVDKAAEGYNDFYFADDAYQNVIAVRDALSVIDVKSKVQQARIKESKKLDEEFNMLLEESTGVESFKEYSAAKARTIGASKGKFKFFIPYSAEDFLGLIYPTLSKGTKGDAQMAWYKQNLLNPYTKAQENLSAARIQLMGDFKQLKKSLDVPKDLRKKNESGFTNEQAVRVSLFTRMGFEVSGLSKRDLKELNDIVDKNPKLSTFADQILTITKGDGYAAPDKNWLAGTITTDLISLINTEKRSKYLAEWQERVDVIYSSENLNKLEAIYGTKYREALEGVLTRMKTGKNRVTSGNALENRILDYINGSIGTIMFFNTRSAVLQTISSINFINWSFNNPLKAGAAFANQKQYWSDFVELMNSEYLVDRRNGLKLNISESEIADAAATSKNKAKAAINYILQKGFLPTQYADSFAIASGGASFYRNRIKDLVKNQSMTETEAKAQALIEFRQVAEESQQSSDPSRISQQQASSAGRLILAFANTPMQYARLQKRAIQDLVNGRGDAKSHVSRIIYYGFVQNIIFNALQQAVNVFGFGDDEEEDPKKEKKYLNVANGMLDSLLRGIGIGGAAVSVGKNFLLDIYERSKRPRPEYVDSVWKLTQFSPPINSKISRLKQAAWHFDSKKRRQKILDEGFSLNSPAFEAIAKVVSATTNFPLDRVLYKIKNIEGALAEDTELWMRVAQLGGWPRWQLEDKKTAPVLNDEQKAKAKETKNKNLYKEAKGSTDYDTLKKLNSAQQIKMLKSLGFGEYTIKKAKSEEAKINLIIAKNSGKKNIVNKKEADKYKYKKLSKTEQIKKLDSLGLSKDEIKALKYENDRVDKILELMK